MCNRVFGRVGIKHSLETYYSAESSIILNYIDYFKAIDGINIQQKNTDNNARTDKNYTAIGDIIVIKDKDNNFLYMSIDSFNNEGSDGDLIAATIKNSSAEVDNIIIDLRNNGGGYSEYAYKLLSAISCKNFEISDDVFITNEVYKKLRNKVILFLAQIREPAFQPEYHVPTVLSIKTFFVRFPKSNATILTYHADCAIM